MDGVSVEMYTLTLGSPTSSALLEGSGPIHVKTMRLQVGDVIRFDAHTHTHTHSPGGEQGRRRRQFDQADTHASRVSFSSQPPVRSI